MPQPTSEPLKRQGTRATKIEARVDVARPELSS